MRKRNVGMGVVVVALVWTLQASAADRPELAVQQSTPPDIIARGVSIEPSRRMRAKGFAWDHEIQIALPPSYRKTNKAYPVLWVTDGSFQFQAAVEAVNVTENGHLPEMIVVGIGAPPEALAETWVRRDYDFTPTAADEGFDGFGGELLAELLKKSEKQNATARVPVVRYGGAPEFLAFLVDTVRPALARDYRMANDHTLFGHSGGGLFCTYALIARPAAFEKYICGSPSLNVGNAELFRMEERYAATHKDLPASVFFGAGEGEVLQGGYISASGIVSSMTRMAEILTLRNYPSLKLHVRLFPGEEHVSMMRMNLNWGLRTLWNSEGEGAREK